MHNYPLWASKQISARIDFLRQGGQLVDKKATFYVKFLAESWTNGNWPHTRLCATARKNTCAYYRQRERL